MRRGIIPNWLSYSGVLLALIFSFFDPSRSLSITIIGFVVGFSPAFFLFLIGRLGGGDVKLLAMLGAAFGFPLIIDLLLWTCVFGFLVAFSVVLVRGRLKVLIMDIRETIIVSVLQRAGRTEVPVRGLSMPLAVAIFMSVCWIVFFPELATLARF